MQTKVRELHNMMSVSGLAGAVELMNQCFDVTTGKLKKGKILKAKVIPGKEQDNENANAVIPTKIDSEVTIYKNAIQKRNSSSSEDEEIDMSKRGSPPDSLLLAFPDQPIPVTSHQYPKMNVNEMGRPVGKPQQPLPIEEQTNKVIQEAEAARARIFPPSGNNYSNHNVDQDYLVIGVHVDELMQIKIVIGEYIDFSRLLPRDKLLTDDDARLELIVRNGKAFWSPVSKSVTISNFNHWEQAFRIFSNIYTRYHPHKLSELIEYNHVIHTISLTYVWDNVYAYNKEFHMHISKHPIISCQSSSNKLGQ